MRLNPEESLEWLEKVELDPPAWIIDYYQGVVLRHACNEPLLSEAGYGTVLKILETANRSVPLPEQRP